MKTKIILICGPQGAGKTTLAKEIAKLSRVRAVGLKFADPLYLLHERIWKTMEDYGLNKANYLKSSIDGRLLQLLGSQWGRAMDPEIWVKIMQERVSFYPSDTIIVIDDCRFENELRAFPEESTVRVKLVASEAVRKLRAEKWREDTTHISEIGLDHVNDAAYDFIFETENTSAEQIAELILDEINR